MTKLTNSLEEFEDYCVSLLPKFSAGTLIVLDGELGVGKTTLVKVIAKSVGILENITSPTYAILKEYDKKLCHIDAYRIGDEDLEINYYLQAGYIIFVEWAQNIVSSLPDNYFRIKISYTQQLGQRLIECEEV